MPVKLFFGVLLVWGLAVPAVLAEQQSATKDGDVVLALNGACTKAGWLSCSSFLQAIFAWEQRAVIVDLSPGSTAVPSSAPTFTVGWDIKDHGGVPGVGVSNSVANWMQRDPPVHAQVGLSWSSVTMASAQLAHHTEHVMVGYSATSAQLSAKDQYGYFMRTCPPDSLQASALLALVLKFNALQVGFMYVDEPYSVGIFNNFREDAPPNLEIYAEGLVHQPGVVDVSKWIGAFLRMRVRKERYIVSSYGEGHFWELAHATGLWTADRQWICAETTVAKSDKDFSKLVGVIGVRPVNQGQLHPAWTNWTSTSLTASQFPDMLRNEPRPVTDEMLKAKTFRFYDPYHVDATFAILFAIERLHASGVPLAECRGKNLRGELYKTRFMGASGFVAFDENGDRQADYEVWNIGEEGIDLDRVTTRGMWSVETGLRLGGWEGNVESPDYPLLVFTNGSRTPHPTVVGGCPKGHKYVGVGVGCAPCDVGTFNPVDASTSTECLPCDEGFHAPSEGLAICAICPTGTFQNSTGQATCDLCPAGTFSSASGLRGCEPCSQGTWSDAGSTTCTLCEHGFFAQLQGMESCTRCPAGFTTEFAGSTLSGACSCPRNSVFLPNAKGECYRCDDPASPLSHGLRCLGGRSCMPIPNRTIVSSFPCPSVGEDCLEPGGGACAARCVVSIVTARQLCESFEYTHICEGWSVVASAFQHSDLLSDDTKYGWQNVAILGLVSQDVATATAYGVFDANSVLFPRRSLCSPVAAGDPGYLRPSHAKHGVDSFDQPPLALPGFYLASLQAVRQGRVPNSVDGRHDDGSPVLMDEAMLAQERHGELQLRTPVATAWQGQYFRMLPVDAASTDVPGPIPLFKCLSASVCPGGHVGQCFPGQTGFSCARCVEGFYTSSSVGCAPCTGGDLSSLVLVLFVLGLLVLFVWLYQMSLQPLASQLSAKLTTGLALGLTLNGLQTFGVMSLMSIDFGEPLSSILTSMRLLLFDMDQLQWECVMPISPIGKLTVRLMVPPVVCLMYLALFCGSHVLHAFWPSRVEQWTVPHTLNSAGMVLQVLFISICMGVIMPFKCAEQPVGGLLTMSDIPFQVCGLGEHTGMHVAGAVFVFLYPVLGMAACTYVIYILPQRTAEDPTFLNYFKFLVSRFRFDRYYFGVVFMVRNLCIALVPVLNPNNPLLQQIVMACLLLTALCGQALLWPWAAAEVNFLDLSCLWCMIVTVVVSAGLVDSKTVDVEGMNLLAAVMVSIAFGLMAIVVLDAAVKIVADICVRRGKCLAVARRFDTSKRSSLQVEDLATGLENMVGTLGVWNKRHHVAFVRSLPAYDRDALHRVLAMMNGAIDIDTSTGGMRQSSRHLRITVNRFKRRSSLQATFPTIAGAAATNAHMEDDTCDVSV